MQLGLRFLECDFLIETPCGDDGLWLAEFLGPAFSSTVPEPRSAVEVVLRVDPGRVDAWLAQSPSGDETLAFRLDQREVRLPTWRTGGANDRLAWDERSRAFYRVLPVARRVEVWCREPGRKARRALMRAVREVSIDHALRTDGLLLHASCFASGSGAIAFSGPKGCGKTTLLIAALAGTPSTFLANDRVFVDLSRDSPHAIAVPSIVSLRASSLRHFPALARAFDSGMWNPWLRWQDRSDQVAAALAREEGRQALSPFQFCRWLDCPWTAQAPLALLTLPRVEPGRVEVAIRRLSASEAEERLPQVLFAAGSREESELFALDATERPGATPATRSPLVSRVPMIEMCLPPDRVDASTWLPGLLRHLAGAAS